MTQVEINKCPRSFVMPMADNNLQRFLGISQYAWEGKVNGEQACLWGLIPPTLLSDQAYLWLHTTAVAEQHQFLLVRYSQRMIQRMLEEFPLIFGHCALADTSAQRWLRWLGAEFDFPQGKLAPFTIRRKQNG